MCALDLISLSLLRDYNIVITPSLTCIIMFHPLLSNSYQHTNWCNISYNILPYIQITTLQITSSFQQNSLKELFILMISAFLLLFSLEGFHLHPSIKVALAKVIIISKLPKPTGSA